MRLLPDSLRQRLGHLAPHGAPDESRLALRVALGGVAALCLALAALAACSALGFGSGSKPWLVGATPTDLPPQITDAHGVPMALVHAGPFVMGAEVSVALAACRMLSQPFTDKTCQPAWFTNEGPVHTVDLKSYYMDQYEVTNGRYIACVEAGVCQPPKSIRTETRPRYYGSPEYLDYPVVAVTWDMAEKYCEWRGARLPTEAEWEKAARGYDERPYPWGNVFDGTRLNFCDVNCTLTWANPEFDDGINDTAPVGTYLNGVSPYGLYDMAGNVWEWVADWYAPDYYARSPAEDPTGPQAGQERVLRGGSWDDTGLYVRAALRNNNPPDDAYDVIGFRCARST